jgi:hypothetical protein
MPDLQIPHLNRQPKSIHLAEDKVRQPLDVHHRHSPFLRFLKLHAAWPGSREGEQNKKFKEMKIELSHL